MATKVADRATVNGNAAVTTVDFVLTGLTVGNLLIIRTAADNSGGGGAARTVTVTNQSGTPIDTTTDQAYQQNNDPGAASAGVTCNVIVALITATSGTVRLTYSGSVVQAGVAEEWTGIDTTTSLGVVGTPVGNTGVASTNLASLTDSSVASSNLVYAVEAIEGPAGDTYTEDSDTTRGSWVSLTKAGTTNATADTNMTVAGGYKIAIGGTGSQIYNPTNSVARDSAGLILEFASIDQFAGAGVATATGTANSASIPQQLPIEGTGLQSSAVQVAPFTGTPAKYLASWLINAQTSSDHREFRLYTTTDNDTWVGATGPELGSSPGLGTGDDPAMMWRQSDTQIAYFNKRGPSSVIGTIYSGLCAYDSGADAIDVSGDGQGTNTLQPVGVSTGGTSFAFGARMTDSKSIIVADQNTDATTFQVRAKAVTVGAATDTSFSIGSVLDISHTGTGVATTASIFALQVVGLSDTRAVVLAGGSDGSTTAKVYGQLVTCTSGSGTTLGTSGSWTALSDDFLSNFQSAKSFNSIQIDATRFLLLYSESTDSTEADNFLKARIVDITGDTFTLGTEITLDTAQSSSQFVTQDFIALLTDDKVFVSAYQDATVANTYQSITSNTMAPGTSLTITKPASSTTGDLLHAFFAIDGDTGSVTITPPTDWVEHVSAINSGNVGLRSFYKEAGGSEPADYTWTFSSSVTAVGAVLRITGATSKYEPPWTLGDTGAGTNPNPPDQIIGGLAIAVSATDTDVAHTPPSGYTERLDLGAGSTVRLSVATDTQIGTGPIGPAFTASSTNWATLHVPSPEKDSTTQAWVLDVGASGTTLTEAVGRTAMSDHQTHLDSLWYQGPSYLATDSDNTKVIASGSFATSNGPAQPNRYLQNFNFWDIPQEANNAPDAEVATATGTAYTAAASVAVNAGVATATGTAHDATVPKLASAEVATGTGASHQPLANVAPNAGSASGSGTAFNPSISTTDQAPADVATATGTSNAAVPSVSPTAIVATATGTAFSAGVSTTDQAPAEVATATGTSQQPSPSIAVNVGGTSSLPTLLVNGDGDGTANQPRNWAAQSYANIDEGISAADGSTITGPIQAGGDTSFTLANMPADFVSAASMSVNIRYAVANRVDDLFTLLVKVVDTDGNLLASGPNADNFKLLVSPTSGTMTNSGEIAFPTVNTTATKAQWDSAILQIRQGYAPTGGQDLFSACLVDTIELTGTYVAGLVSIGSAHDATVSTASSETADAEVAVATGTANNPSVSISGSAAAVAEGAGTAYGITTLVSASAIAASGIGSAHDATVSTTDVAPADVATGSGVGYSPSPFISPSALIATAVGTAFNAGVSTTDQAPADVATGTGTAHNATITTSVVGAAGVAAATGTSHQPSVSLTAIPSTATASGQANNASAGTNVMADAEVATGAGTSHNASISTTDDAPAELAAGTGAALGVSPAVSPTAGLGTATGTAFNPSVSTTDQAPADVATGSGSGHNPAPAVAPVVQVITATGVAYPVTTLISTAAIVATATGEAHNATVNTSSESNAPAGVAEASGTAHDPSISTIDSASADVATATGTAHTITAMVAASSGAASATGTAHDATITTTDEAPADVASGTGVGHNATTALAAHPSSADGVGAAHDAVATVGGQTNAFAEVAAAVGEAYSAGISTTDQAPADVALGTGTAGDGSISLSVSPTTATSSGEAHDATVSTGNSVFAMAEVAEATGTAFTPTKEMVVQAVVALAIGAAHNATALGDVVEEALIYRRSYVIDSRRDYDLEGRIPYVTKNGRTTYDLEYEGVP